MQKRTRIQGKMQKKLTFYSKCGAVVLLLVFSIVMVACGGGAGAQNSLSDPPVTVTVGLNKGSGTMATQPNGYACGAWVTNTSPKLNADTQVGVNAKFVHNVNGNPEGVEGATAIADVEWPDHTHQSFQATTKVTTKDGLATFAVTIPAEKTNYAGRITLVTVTFTKPGIDTCVVNADRAAFFTLIVVSPTATHGNNPSPTATDPSTIPTRTLPGTRTPTATSTVKVP
jgi:hypothetical protein